MKRLSHTRRIAFALLLTCVGSVPSLSAAAKESRSTNRVSIEYVRPTNPEHQKIYALLKERRVLERLQTLLSPVRLPETLWIKTKGCDGVSNAWYEESDHTVTVCYEYFADLQSHAPAQTTAAGVTPDDAVIGPGIEVFLHEAAHALFDMLHVPILGREEDAADQIAAYMLLRVDKDLSRRSIAAVALMYAKEVQSDDTPGMKHFADVHSLPAQRLYNLLCMAYGADPVLFADAIDRGSLPAERAEDCSFEYEQVDYAFRRLIAPSIDRNLVKKLQVKRLFRAPDIKHK